MFLGFSNFLKYHVFCKASGKNSKQILFLKRKKLITTCRKEKKNVIFQTEITMPPEEITTF